MPEPEDPEALRDVARVAAGVLGVSAAQVRSVERIKGGLTNESWRVAAAGQILVVRVSRADDEALQIDRESELRVLEAAWSARIGPEVLACEPRRRLLVTRHIAGRVWSEADASAPENVARLGRLFASLHTTPVPSGVQRVDVAQSLEGYWRTLGGEGGGPEGEAMLSVARSLAAADAARLCHNDVHRLNLVDDGRCASSIGSTRGSEPVLRSGLRVRVPRVRRRASRAAAPRVPGTRGQAPRSD